MTAAVLSIGGNLDDRLSRLRAARDGLSRWLRATSAVYETTPWGPVEQDDFLNAVLVVDDPDATPAQWLQRAHALERAAGRRREVRFGPRTLDVDVIAVRDGDADVVSNDPVLTLPHPRAAERAFVLVPWFDADPDAVLPGRGAVRDLVAGLPSGEVAGVQRRDDLVLG